MNLDTLWAAKAEPIEDAEAERSLINQAKAGSEAATLRLLKAYLPVLRKAVEAWKQSISNNPDEGREEARSAAIIGFLEAIQQFQSDRWDRLAATVRYPIARALESAAGSDTPISVPPRQRARYFSIMEAADGDVGAALELLEGSGMTQPTFMAVHNAVVNTVYYHQGTGSDAHDEEDSNTGEDLLVDTTQDRYQVAQDRVMMAHTAMRAVSDDKRAICRLYYGFDARDAEFSYDVDRAVELKAAIGSDNNTAKELGSTRPTVQRKRAAALVEMREVLTDE